MEAANTSQPHGFNWRKRQHLRIDDLKRQKEQQQKLSHQLVARLSYCAPVAEATAATPTRKRKAPLLKRNVKPGYDPEGTMVKVTFMKKLRANPTILLNAILLWY